MNNKINKNKVQDVFEGIKYVDKMMNEAAGIKTPSKLSFEEQLKKKLSNKKSLNESMDNDQDDLNEYSYNHATPTNTYDGKGLYEDDLDIEDDFNDDFEGDDFSNEDDFMADTEKFDFEDEDEEEHDFMSDNYMESDDSDLDDAELQEMLFSEDDMDIPQPQGEDPAMPELPAETAPAIGDEAGMEGDMEGDMDGIAPEGDMGDLEGGMDDMGDMGGSSSPMPSMGGGSSAPAGDMGAEGDMSADMSAPATMTEPEDIDSLIADLVSDNDDENGAGMLGESVLSDLGYEDLDDEDLDDKVKGEKGSKIKLETEEELTEAIEKMTGKKVVFTKLKDDDLTSKVKGATTKISMKGNKADTKATSATKGLDFTDAGDDDLKGSVKDAKATKMVEPKYDTVKENATKTKAIYKLAEQYTKLEDEFKTLKFEHYKALKVNGILTLLPELKQSTREGLVEKFDKCKTFSATRKLYAEITEMVKEHKKPSLNEAVNKRKNNISYASIKESRENTIDPEQARKDFLMGIAPDEEQYGNL